MVDRYTKIILTIIAANLTIVTLQNLDLIPQANAVSGIQKVAICDASNSRRCAKVTGGVLRVR